MKANYRNIPALLKNKQEFKGSSMSAEHLTKNGQVYGGFYAIFSYSTCMAIIGDNNEVLKFNNDYYSATTSKHQNIIKRVFDIK